MNLLRASLRLYTFQFSEPFYEKWKQKADNEICDLQIKREDHADRIVLFRKKKQSKEPSYNPIH